MATIGTYRKNNIMEQVLFFYKGSACVRFESPVHQQRSSCRRDAGLLYPGSHFRDWLLCCHTECSLCLALRFYLNSFLNRIDNRVTNPEICLNLQRKPNHSLRTQKSLHWNWFLNIVSSTRVRLITEILPGNPILNYHPFTHSLGLSKYQELF